MVEFIIGAAAGAGAMFAKDLIVGNKSQQEKATNDQRLEELYNENEKLRNRNKEAERKIEDLVAENQKLTRKFKDKDDDADDMEDQLADTKLKVKKLQQQNDELLCKIQEYKSACESYEMEIAQLKNK